MWFSASVYGRSVYDKKRLYGFKAYDALAAVYVQGIGGGHEDFCHTRKYAPDTCRLGH